MPGRKAVTTMHVISLVLELELPSTSLKSKRGIVKSLLARARNRFNVAAAEVADQDDWGTALVAFVTVSGDRAYARRLLEQVEEWIVRERPDLPIRFVDYEER